jgi:hypothetical protein
VKDRHAIDGHLAPILKRLNIDVDAWQLAMRPSGNVFGRAMGQVDHLLCTRRHSINPGFAAVGRAQRMFG